MNKKIQDSINIIRQYIGKIKPDVTVVCFSGGNDSSTVLHLAMKNNCADCVLFLDTGISIPETKTFVENHCMDSEYKLFCVKTPESYEKEVIEHGFPGPPQHLLFYSKLKERALRRFKRENYPRKKVLLLTGARATESDRRKYNTELYRFDGQFHWLNPIMNWEKRDCLQYLRANNVKTNPVSALLGMSGECLCGAFASKGELEMICELFPETGKQIKELQEKVFANGFFWGWEDSPPKGYSKGQGVLPGIDMSALCQNCERKNYEHKSTDQEREPTTQPQLL